ncbi:MAG: hypothetical protein KA004_03590 [Verrucomicrobiales bacterium]|nr:hypothetical protein [Verrucomicrobiales bacterium]
MSFMHQQRLLRSCFPFGTLAGVGLVGAALFAAVTACWGQDAKPLVVPGRLDVEKLVPELRPNVRGAVLQGIQRAVRLVPANRALNVAKAAHSEPLPKLSGPRTNLPWPEGTLTGPFLLTLDDGTRIQGHPVQWDGTALTWNWPTGESSLEFLMPLAGTCRRLEAKPAHAWNDTVKLCGGSGWMQGDVLAVNGKEVVFRAYGTSEVRLPRQSVEWLHLSRGQAPGCFDLASGTAAFTNREGSEPSAWALQDGMLMGSTNEAIGTMVTGVPDRLHMVVEVLHDPAFTPFAIYLNAAQVGMSSNLAGACWFRITGQSCLMGAYEGSRYLSRSIKPAPAQPVVPPPGGEPGAAALHVYEAWIDRAAGAFSLRVNGGGIETLKFSKPIPASARPRAFSLNPMFAPRGKGSFGVRRFLVEPWDGRTESGGIGAALADGTWKGGELGSLDGKSAVLGGERIARSQLRFARLQPACGAVKVGGDSAVRFVGGGILPATNLRLDRDHLEMDTTVAGPLSIRLADVAGWKFPGVPVKDRLEEASRLQMASGEVLRGTFAGGSDETCAWRLQDGAAPVEISWQKMRAVVTGQTARDAATTPAFVLLQNGDFMLADSLQIKDGSFQMSTASAGAMTWPLSAVQWICPGGAGFCEGGIRMGPWKAGFGSLQPQFTTSAEAEKALQLRSRFQSLFPWDAPLTEPVYDGVFTSSGKGSVNIRRVVTRPPRSFEIRFRLLRMAGYQMVRVVLFGRADGAVMSLNLQEAFAYCQEMHRAENGPVFPRTQSARSARAVHSVGGDAVEYRLLVDAGSGRLAILVNGSPLGALRGTALRQIYESGQLGLGISFTPAMSGRVVNGVTEAFPNPVLLHDLFVLPWNGSERAPDPAADFVLLSNGDTGPGSISSLTNSSLLLHSEDVGDMEIPLSRVAGLRKGAQPAEGVAEGNFRLRLADGSAVSVQSFRCQAEALHATLPDGRPLELPLKNVREIVRMTK